MADVRVTRIYCGRCGASTDDDRPDSRYYHQPTNESLSVPFVKPVEWVEREMVMIHTWTDGVRCGGEILIESEPAITESEGS